MPSKKIRALIRPLALLFFCLVASALLLNALIQRPSFQAYLMGRISKVTGYDIHARDISLNFRQGLGISAVDVEAGSGSGSKKVTAEEAIITLDLSDLIRGVITPTSVYLLSPKIELSMEKGKTHPGLESLGAIFSERLFRLKTVSLENASFSATESPWGLKDVSFSVFRKGEGPAEFKIMTRGKALFGENAVPFKLDGTIVREALEGKDGKPFAEVLLDTGGIPLSSIPWPDFLPFKSGRAKLRLELRGWYDGAISTQGEIIAEDLEFQLLDEGRQTDYSFSDLEVKFRARYSQKLIEISSMEVKGTDFSLKAESNLDFGGTSGPKLSLTVKSSFMPLDAVKKIYPGAILPEWISSRLFPLFKDGEGRLDSLSLRGTLNEIENFDLPENAGSLLLQVSWKDLEILLENSSLPFKRVSGEMRIEDRGLFIRDVGGSFGRSVLKEGSLVIKDLYADCTRSDVAVKGNFELEDLLYQRKTFLVPDFADAWINKIESMSGRMDADARAQYEEGETYPRILDGDIQLNNCSFNYKGFPFPLSLNEADIKLGGEGEIDFWSAGMLGKSSFKASGSFGALLKEGRLQIQASADMNEITACFYDGDKLPLRFSEQLKCRLYLSRSEEVLSLKGLADLEGVVIETPSFSMDPLGGEDRLVFSLEYRKDKEQARLKTFKCHLGDSLLEMNGEYDHRESRSFNIRVAADQFRLSDLGITFRRTNAPAKGILDFEAEARGSADDLSTVSVLGDIQGRGISLILSDLPSSLSDCDFEAEFSDKKVVLKYFDVLVGRSPVHLEGNLLGWDGLKGQISAKSDYLNLSDFIPATPDLDASDQDWDGNRFIERSDVKVYFDAAKGEWKGLKCGSIEAECTFKRGIFGIERSRISLEQGVINIKGRIRGGMEPQKSFSSYVKIDGQPIKDFLPLFGFEKQPLEGLLHLEGVFLTKGRSGKELLSGLKGEANVLLEKGVVKQSRVIFKVLDFLSLQKIFEKRPEDISEKGFYFERIKGHFNIDKGAVETDRLVMKSSVFNAVSKGSVDLAKGVVDFDLGIQPFGTIDALISRVPIVGYILTGKEKSLLIYYFKVKGPLSGPDVKYVPLENLGSETVGFFRRLFFTPGRIFKEMSRMLQGLSGEEVPLPEED